MHTRWIQIIRIRFVFFVFGGFFVATFITWHLQASMCQITSYWKVFHRNWFVLHDTELILKPASDLCADYMSKIFFHKMLSSAQFSDISEDIFFFYLFHLHHNDATVTVTRRVRRSPSPASWLSDICSPPVWVSVRLPSPSSVHLGFLCRVFLSVSEYSRQSLSVSLTVSPEGHKNYWL